MNMCNDNASRKILYNVSFSLSISRNDIYMYTWKTLFDFFIIDSDLNLFSLTNYLVRMMQAVSQHSSLI